MLGTETDLKGRDPPHLDTLTLTFPFLSRLEFSSPTSYIHVNLCLPHGPQLSLGNLLHDSTVAQLGSSVLPPLIGSYPSHTLHLHRCYFRARAPWGPLHSRRYVWNAFVFLEPVVKLNHHCASLRGGPLEKWAGHEAFPHAWASCLPRGGFWVPVLCFWSTVLGHSLVLIACCPSRPVRVCKRSLYKTNSTSLHQTPELLPSPPHTSQNCEELLFLFRNCPA